MKPVRTRDDPARDPREQTREDYLDFARRAVDSPCLRGWAFAVADDPEVLALVGGLPPAKQQPNLVFAAARWHGAAPVPYSAPDGLRAVLVDGWADVRATVLRRATQTNEVGRCATLLPVLAGLPGVLWRRGIDLRPLDVRDDDSMRWLQHLVWPEHEDRRDRLTAAVRLARDDPPVLVPGDLVTELPRLAAQAPPDATLVVFHSAVLAYLDESDRERFGVVVQEVVEHGGHWVSNEGPAVLPDVAATAPPPRDGSVVGRAPFLLALDGRPVAWTQGHGRAISWSGPRAVAG
jgi:hypothetical protein